MKMTANYNSVKNHENEPKTLSMYEKLNHTLSISISCIKN